MITGLKNQFGNMWHSQSNKSNSLCIKTSSSSYFEKAEIFIELGNEFSSVIKNSKNVAQARSFTGFLLEKQVNNIYEKYGFINLINN